MLSSGRTHALASDQVAIFAYALRAPEVAKKYVGQGGFELSTFGLELRPPTIDVKFRSVPYGKYTDKISAKFVEAFRSYGQNTLYGSEPAEAAFPGSIRPPGPIYELKPRFGPKYPTCKISAR